MSRPISSSSPSLSVPPSTPGSPSAARPLVSSPSPSSAGVTDSFAGRPATVARELADRLSGLTARGDEKAILSALESVGSRAELEATFFELTRLGASLPEKLIRDVSDRSLGDRMGGKEIPDEGQRLWRLLMPGTAVPQSHPKLVEGLRRAALELGSVSRPTIFDYARSELARTTRPIEAFGQSFPRLDRTKESTKGSFGNDVLNVAYRAYDKSKLTGLVNRLFGHEDTESPAAVERALKSPLVTGADGRPKSLGNVTVLVNGMLNLEPTAAMMFKLSRHTDGPLVLASSNPDGPDGYRLRELTEVWGTPVPPELRGKLWAVGDLSATMMSWPQGSDLLLEHLAVLGREFGTLQQANPTLQKFDSFRDSKTTVVGYSQGALSAAAARKRLNDAGMSDVIDQLISVAGSFGGATAADATDSAEDVSGPGPGLRERLAAGAGRILGQVDDEEGRRALEANDPDFTRAMWKQLGLTEDLIDLGYATRSGDGSEKKVEPFFGLTALINERLLGAAPKHGTDGVVVTSEAAIGRRVVIDERAKTHLHTWKDQDTFDRILQEL